jgi:hypothetical protein
MMTIRVNSSKELTESPRLHIPFSVNPLHAFAGMESGFLSETVTVLRLFHQQGKTQFQKQNSYKYLNVNDLRIKKRLN